MQILCYLTNLKHKTKQSKNRFIDTKNKQVISRKEQVELASYD